MTCTDIVKIIASCGESGVESFKYQGLELTLGNGRRMINVHDTEPSELLTYPIDPDNTSRYDSTEEDNLDEEDIEGIPVDQVLDELKFTDPEAWDKLAQVGEV